MDRPGVTYVEDSPNSGQLAIENALDTSPGTVEEQTPPVTLDSYLQALPFASRLTLTRQASIPILVINTFTTTSFSTVK